MAFVDISSKDRNLHFRYLGERDFCVAMPKGHPLAGSSGLTAAQICSYPQIGFSHNQDSFEKWASHPDAKNRYSCQVNTVSSALDLVSAGLGIAVIPKDCQIQRADIVYAPLKNRHQALYASILYNRWLDPPIWNFVDQVITTVRNAMQ